MNLFRNHRNRVFSATAFVVIAALIVFGPISASPSNAQSQTQDAAAIKFEFDVASVKPSNPNAVGGFMTIPGPGAVSDTFSVKNLTPIMLIRSACGIPMGAADSRIAGAPSWLSSEKYDVEAKIDSSVVEQLKKLSPDQRSLAQQHMLQALLADRFKLVIHRETKELPMYTLVIAKNGPKLQESKPEDAPPQDGGRGRGGRGGNWLRMTGRGGPITGHMAAVADLSELLSVLLGRPVQDKTGLTGKYDFTLQWTPDEGQQGPNFPGDSAGASAPAAPESNGPSIFTALQEQLGLKLESGKGPVEIIVIDHVERPSGN